VETAKRLGVPPPISIQNDFSLTCRHFESELAEACAPSNYNIGLLAYGALAGGALSDKYLGPGGFEAAPPEARHRQFPSTHKCIGMPCVLGGGSLHPLWRRCVVWDRSAGVECVSRPDMERMDHTYATIYDSGCMQYASLSATSVAQGCASIPHHHHHHHLHFQLRPASGLHEYTSQAALEHTQATITHVGPAHHHIHLPVPAIAPAAFQPRYISDRVQTAAVKYAAIAKRAGITTAQLAYAWAATRWYMGSVIIGATTMEQVTPCNAWTQAVGATVVIRRTTC
jgi:hypothetical protein